MVFEDGSNPTFAGLESLKSRKNALNCPDLEIRTVPQFLDHAKSMRLTRREKETIVEQATLLIDQFYAHLPFKRARYATDPVQRFRLIHAQLDHLTDLAFHDEMIQAFMRLRDAHTFYGLPEPFRGAFAFLPFRLDCFYDEKGGRRFVVTNLLAGFSHSKFGVGAEVTLWNGMPLETAIARENFFEPGGNSAARFVRGLRRLAKRSLTFSVPPDERFVVVQYIPQEETHEHSIVLPWCIASSYTRATSRKDSSSSVNESMAELQQLGGTLWYGKPVPKDPGKANSYGSTINLSQESIYPHVFAFQYSGGKACLDAVQPSDLQDEEHPDRKFGYLRIKTFELNSGDDNASEQFFTEFLRIVDLMQEMAPDGLILDVRCNPGGAIDAAERILQLLTPSEIEPAKFHFINSRITQQIAATLRETEAQSGLDEDQREWLPWVDDLLASITSGLFVTPGRPLTSADQANDTGQRYQGPVVLVIDASSYSATDIFAAGFQDHGIGTVIGVDENTGGGGANRWLHENLRVMMEKVAPSIPLKKLPRQAQMGLALRRSSRVGTRAGSVIEDEGVKRDIEYRITRNDILNQDQDLLRFACKQLSTGLTPRLRILSAVPRSDGIALTVETRNVFRIECRLDGRPQCAFAANGPQPFLVPNIGLIDKPSVLQVDGVAMIEGGGGVQQWSVVARRTIHLDAGSGS